MSAQDPTSKIIGDIMAKSWADDAFKSRLLADATATLKAEGVSIPEGITVNVVENTDKIVNYVLPRNPNGDLSDADLEEVAGGKKGRCGQEFNWFALHAQS
jgi:hypothetical protein